MQLTHMYYLMKQIETDLNSFHITRHTTGNGQAYHYIFENYILFSNTLADLQKLDYFAQEILSIKKIMEKMYQVGQEYRIYGLEGDHLLKVINSIRTTISAVTSFLESIGMNTDNQGFDVKIPPTKDFSEFTQYVNILNKILSQCPYLNRDDGNIEIKSVDIGSIWFNFIAYGTGGCLILKNLATIVNECVKIKSHILTCEQQKTILKSMQQKQEVMDAVIEGFEKYKEQLLNESCDNLKAKLGDLANGEDETRVKYTITALSDLMAKGLEIYAAIDAPTEVKDLFPTTDQILALDEAVKLLKEDNSIDK